MVKYILLFLAVWVMLFILCDTTFKQEKVPDYIRDNCAREAQYISYELLIQGRAEAADIYSLAFEQCLDDWRNK